MPIYRCGKFDWKISQIKYAIFDRSHNLEMDLLIMKQLLNYGMDRIETWNFALPKKLI
jgi:hypothetical protein